jgi:hypothetical protein
MDPLMHQRGMSLHTRQLRWAGPSLYITSRGGLVQETGK